MTRFILFIFFIFIISCSINGAEQGLNSNFESNISTSLELDSNLYYKIINTLHKLEKNKIQNFSINKEYLDNINLFFDDPSYIKGPSIEVNKQSWAIRYSTTTCKDDGNIKYQDSYCYFFPIGDSIVYYKNRYNGKGYHGGCTKVMSKRNDKRFSNIKPPLHTEYNDIAKVLSVFINDSSIFCHVKSELTRYYRKLLKDLDIRDFSILDFGINSEKIFDKNRLCYSVIITYSTLNESHTKFWHFDILNKEAFYLSEYREKWSPGQIYKGSMTSNYIDVTNKDISSNILSLFE